MTSSSKKSSTNTAEIVAPEVPIVVISDGNKQDRIVSEQFVQAVTEEDDRRQNEEEIGTEMLMTLSAQMETLVLTASKAVAHIEIRTVYNLTEKEECIVAKGVISIFKHWSFTVLIKMCTNSGFPLQNYEMKDTTKDCPIVLAHVKSWPVFSYTGTFFQESLAYATGNHDSAITATAIH